MNSEALPLFNGVEARASDREHIGWVTRMVPLGFQGTRVIDLGCGSGYLCAYARYRGAQSVVGIDLADPTIDPDGEYTWSHLRLDLDANDWHENLSVHGSVLDRVFAFDILEHLRSPVQFLEKCRSLLSEQGYLVLSTPNVLSWERFLHPLTWSGARDPEHKVLFSSYSLRFLLERLGFEVITMKAPLRSLRWLEGKGPQIGAQLLCTAGHFAHETHHG